MKKPGSTILTSSPVIDSWILLDATILIEAIRNSEVVDLFDEWRKNGCELYTIPEVVFEVAHGTTESYREYAETYDFCNRANISILNLDRQVTEQQAKDMQFFSFLYSKYAKQGSYTDYKLCLAAFRFPAMKLLSGNTRDIPDALFKKIGGMIVARTAAARAEVLFEFDKTQYGHLMRAYNK